MIKQINIDRTRDKVVRVVVIYDKNREDRYVDSFDELTEEEIAFFKDNAKNVWWWGSDGRGVDAISTYIVNPYESHTICSKTSA